jgi:hypothetical protein
LGLLGWQGINSLHDRFGTWNILRWRVSGTKRRQHLKQEEREMLTGLEAAGMPQFAEAMEEGLLWRQAFVRKYGREPNKQDAERYRKQLEAQCTREKSDGLVRELQKVMREKV